MVFYYVALITSVTVDQNAAKYSFFDENHPLVLNGKLASGIKILQWTREYNMAQSLTYTIKALVRHTITHIDYVMTMMQYASLGCK
jgi:hypothetical protein